MSRDDELVKRATNVKQPCDGDCEHFGGHSGDVITVHVVDWGIFNYCQSAISEDRRRGFTVVGPEEKSTTEILEGAGEPVALFDEKQGKLVIKHNVPIFKDGDGVYTADQLAAAVLREREACAKVCDHDWGTDSEKDAGIIFAAAIRARSGEKK